MSKYLRYEKAQGLPAYVKLVDECTLELAKHGSFSKQYVVDRAELTGVDGDIRWDYIAKMIEEKQSTELIPMAASFFKRHKKGHEVATPALFMAAGHGRRAAGYAIVSRENGHFVVHRLKMKRSLARGLDASADRTIDAGVKASIPAMMDEKIKQITKVA